MKRILTGVALAGIVAAGITVAAGSDPVKAVDPKAGIVDLSGAWRFDPERSDKPPERMGGGHGGHGGGGMHGGGMHGGGMHGVRAQHDRSVPPLWARNDDRLFRPSA